MMRAVFARASSQQRELPSVAAASVRYYFAPQSLSFTQDVSIAKPSVRGEAPSILDSWKAKADETAHLLQLLQTYKDLGDSKNEPYLKFHNPRTFEDLGKPLPNFRAMSLKAGEVPRFFDSVLQGRASDAVAQKQAWWAERKQEAEAAVQGKDGKAAAALPTVPLPAWSYGSAVSMSNLQSVTDKYVKALEPRRKLHLAPLPAQVKDSLSAFAASLKQERAAGDVADMVLRAMAEKAVVTEGGKPVEGLQYVSKAVAAKVLAARRAQVHERYVKYWAKKVLVQPELAAVPLREVDAQLASRFENVAPAYSEVLAAAGAGPKTLGQRVAASPAFTKFFLRREVEADVVAELPPSESEAQGAALAARYESDPAAALKALLGPEADAPLGAGTGPLSAQVRAVTEHRYTPDRYLYKEGMALAARLEKEEAAARAAGQDLLNPPTPIQQIIERMKRGAPSPQSADAADSPYAAYVAKKLHEFHSDPSNIAMDELLLPEEVSEMLDIELAELAEAEASIADAEEEELWSLTLAAQLKHLQKHFGVDLPHGVIAHMDPLLVKKIDWETSNNLEDWDITLEDMGAEYAKEQWGMESLSHHLLPLIRYRRARAKSQGARFDPELASPVRG